MSHLHDVTVTQHHNKPYPERRIKKKKTMETIDDEEECAPAPVPERSRIEWQLYTSHFLSMWNSRLFEFGAVLFLAAIFPSTLAPMSIYALVRSASAMVFAHPLGRWIDTGNRLVIVRVSILGQRLAVAASCGVFWAMERIPGLFAVLVALACVEKLCATMNTIAVERDWVRPLGPVLVSWY